LIEIIEDNAMPTPTGYTKIYKLRTSIKKMMPGEVIDCQSAIDLHGTRLCRSAISRALAEFALNGLLRRQADGKYVRL
jgi:hypothetical protein